MKYPIKFELEFRRHNYPGRLIAIEGIDGCGKTTQIKSLKKWFEERGKRVVLTSEPRKEENIVGRLIRDALKRKVNLPFSCFQDLYSAERVINHEEVVIPALKEDKIVLSHRCFWSAVAYGVFDKGEVRYGDINSSIIMVANGILSLYYQFMAPNITFYLAISADTAMKRITKMAKKREIYEEKEKLSRVIAGYEWLAKKFSREIIRINGEQKEERVTEKIVSCIK